MLTSNATSGSPLTPPPPAVSQAAKGLGVEFVIGALVPPVLLGLLASRVMANAMTQAGMLCEQFYRGERLPTLRISATETTAE